MRVIVLVSIKYMIRIFIMLNVYHFKFDFVCRVISIKISGNFFLIMYRLYASYHLFRQEIFMHFSKSWGGSFPPPYTHNKENTKLLWFSVNSKVLLLMHLKLFGMCLSKFLAYFIV